jgi:hypothetical protein
MSIRLTIDMGTPQTVDAILTMSSKSVSGAESSTCSSYRAASRSASLLGRGAGMTVTSWRHSRNTTQK